MIFFGKCKFELHVHRIMEFNDSKIDSHVSECCERLYPGRDPKFRTSCSRNMSAKLCEVFLNSIKKQTKSENHETCWDIVISYVENMIKILEDLMHVVMYDAYKPGHLYMWDLISHVEMSWFVSILRDNVHEIFWNFYHSLHIWYHDISTSFMIFGLRLFL